MDSERTYKCPECGYEYEPWVEVCPDCGAILEWRTPSASRLLSGRLDPGEDPRWTIVTNVPNAIIGNLIKSQLEDAGIPVLMMRSSSADIAEFSHNDFVPHDIRVPYRFLRDARQLIDSPPSSEFEDPALPDPFPELETYRRELPEGWSMLPTESDIRARQQIRRAHADANQEGYWDEEESTGAGASSHGWSGRAERDDWYEEEDYDYETPEVVRARVANPYASRRDDRYGNTAGYQSAPNRWIRFFYGIMLLALSLPFILEILRQIWSAFRGR